MHNDSTPSNHRDLKPMISIRLVFVILAILLHSPVQASPNTDALGRCMSDSTTGKDRKDLAKWFFVGMSAHPELGAIAKASAEDTEGVLRVVGTLITRLISEDCPNEMRAVVKAEGTEGIGVAFEFLGKTAMQELVSNPSVTRVIGGFERYVDKTKMEPIFKKQ